MCLHHSSSFRVLLAFHWLKAQLPQILHKNDMWKWIPKQRMTGRRGTRLQSASCHFSDAIKISVSWKMWSDSSHFQCFKHCTVTIRVVSCIAITLARIIVISNPNFIQDWVENCTCTVPILRLFWELEVGKMSMSRNTARHFSYPEVWEQGGQDWPW